MPLAAADLLAAVVAGLSAHFGGLDRLAVHGGGARRRMAAGLEADLPPQGFLEVLPHVPFKSAESGDTTCGRYSRAEKGPWSNSRHSAAGSYQIQNAAERPGVGRRRAGRCGWDASRKGSINAYWLSVRSVS